MWCFCVRAAPPCSRSDALALGLALVAGRGTGAATRSWLGECAWTEEARELAGEREEKEDSREREEKESRECEEKEDAETAEGGGVSWSALR